MMLKLWKYLTERRECEECIYWFALTVKWIDDGWDTKCRQRNCEEDSDARFGHEGHEGGFNKGGVQYVDDQITVAARCLFLSILWLGWRKHFFYGIITRTLNMMHEWNAKAYNGKHVADLKRIGMHAMNLSRDNLNLVLNHNGMTYMIFLNKVEHWSTGARKYWKRSLIFFQEDLNFGLIFRPCIRTMLLRVTHSL